ncbi:type II toxin-antitoxin system VapC family toxin [Pseudoduganella namucuonensis]|uniref:type II toxin-antitoxin system VapC family toxin n=1 Tax=Pseudoduganella namucuonensis TaxID=1035707 RepID=UPI000ADFB204|nr:type II toxin-antitoxin system VapC family toxin [Pseudoduganella namucuonensis]
MLFDTNILIDWSKNYPEALAELAYWDGPAISAITWMELYGGANADEIPRFDAFMAEFGLEIIEIDAEIMQAAAALVAERRRIGPKISLPDAIIAATAKIKGLTLITRNTKDFKGPNVRVPYRLETSITVRIVDVSPPGETPTSGTRPTLTRKK